MKTFLGLLFALVCIAAGTVFRPFWQSEYGAPTFILLVWLTMSVAMGWGGKGKRYAPWFGLVCASPIALSLVLALYTNTFIAAGVLIAIVYFGLKTKFVARRLEELKP